MPASLTCEFRAPLFWLIQACTVFSRFLLLLCCDCCCCWLDWAAGVTMSWSPDRGACTVDLPWGCTKSVSTTEPLWSVTWLSAPSDIVCNSVLSPPPSLAVLVAGLILAALLTAVGADAEVVCGGDEGFDWVLLESVYVLYLGLVSNEAVKSSKVKLFNSLRLLGLLPFPDKAPVRQRGTNPSSI